MLTMPRVARTRSDEARPLRARRRGHLAVLLPRLERLLPREPGAGRSLGAQRRLADAESAAQAAQVRALRYQVNPHFLFNTLNSLSSLVMTGRTDRAETMLLALSTFFRTSLSLDPSADVTPGRGDRSAAALSRYRDGALPGPAHVEIDVPQELEQARLPALLLQPIVENAIKYGVSKSRKAVVIRIEARHARRSPDGARDQQSPEERRQGRASGRDPRRHGPRPLQRLPTPRSALGQPRELPLSAR